MSHRFDVIVIGGGVIGCSVAYHLTRKHLRVAVLEKTAIGGQSSGVAAGMLAAQVEASGQANFLEICVVSRDLFPALVSDVRADTGIDPDWETCGIWRVAVTDEERRELLKEKSGQETRGIGCAWWSPEQVADAFPGLRVPTFGALHFPGDGQIDSGKWVRALAEAARSRGARLVEHVPNVELTAAGNRIVGARTPAENYSADHVVVAAGVWTSFVLAGLGVTFPQEPVKGQLLVLEGFPRMFPGPVFVEHGYFTPKRDGRLIVGATMENAGYDCRPTLSAQHQLADWAVRCCPDLYSRQVLELKAGLRPATPDRLPAMGPVAEWEGLSVCTGHFRNGVLLSPFSGQYMADGIAEGKWDARGRPFSPNRFLTHPQATT